MGELGFRLFGQIKQGEVHLHYGGGFAGMILGYNDFQEQVRFGSWAQIRSSARSCFPRGTSCKRSAVTPLQTCPWTRMSTNISQSRCRKGQGDKTWQGNVAQCGMPPNTNGWLPGGFGQHHMQKGTNLLQIMQDTKKGDITLCWTKNCTHMITSFPNQFTGKHPETLM